MVWDQGFAHIFCYVEPTENQSEVTKQREFAEEHIAELFILGTESWKSLH